MKKVLLLFVTLLLTFSVFAVPVKALEPESQVDPDEPEEYVIVNYDNVFTGSVYVGGLTLKPKSEIYGTITYSGSLITNYSLSSTYAGLDPGSTIPSGYTISSIEQLSCVFSLNSSNYLQANVTYEIKIKDSSSNINTYTRSYVYSVAH